MSAFLDKADAIKTLLEAVPALAGITVIVDRQKKLDSELEKAIGKKKGAAIIIFFNGFETFEQDVESSPVISEFIVTIWTKTVLREGELKADDILEEVRKALHHWDHDDNCRTKAKVPGGKFIPHRQYFVYELRTKIKHHL